MSEKANVASNRVLYFAVHNVDYPRNRMIRSKLDRNSARVSEVVAIDAERGYRRNALTLLRQVFRQRPPVGAVVLAEFSLQFAVFGWLAARRFRCPLVVDWFVGLYETRVEDYGAIKVGGLKARALLLAEKLAICAADIVMTDTEPRALALRERFGLQVMPTVVPVGAPEWAVPSEQMVPITDHRRLLYYGNFIPLHGLPRVIEALAIVSQTENVRLTLIGDGAERPFVESLVRDLGVQDICEFLPSVPEADLAGYISGSEVVFGIFGNSPKAKSVVANKVWQSLACGVAVVTQASPALRELQAVVGDQLITTSNEPLEIANGIRTALERSSEEPVVAADVAERFDELVTAGVSSLTRSIESWKGPGR